MNTNKTNDNLQEMQNLQNNAGVIETYSKEVIDKVSKICEYYEEHDDFYFLQKITMFMVNIIEYHIPEKYFVIPKKFIHHFVKEAMKIWENDGSAEKLAKLNVEYTSRLVEVKPFMNILKDKKERAAMNCMLGILSNGHDNPTNQFIYDFLELFIYELEILNVREKYVRELLDQHFPDLP